MGRSLGESVELFLDSWITREVGVLDLTLVNVEHVDHVIRETPISELSGCGLEDHGVLVVGKDVVYVDSKRVMGELDELTDDLPDRLPPLNAPVCAVEYRIVSERCQEPVNVPTVQRFVGVGDQFYVRMRRISSRHAPQSRGALCRYVCGSDLDYLLGRRWLLELRPGMWCTGGAEGHSL